MKLRRFGLLVSALVLSDAFSLRRCTAVLLWMLRGRWSAPAESGMSHLVNQRMGKRQPMCWSLEGAHFLLGVTAIKGLLRYYVRQAQTTL